MFLNIRPEQIKGLPRYEGDLLLTDHSAGSITSQAYQKRWNRKNELLADAAEKASVGAAWLGSRVYPQERLNNAWTLVMGGQFHDILPGTSTPKAFQFSWNDDVIAMNQFASVLTSATEGIASALNTQTDWDADRCLQSAEYRSSRTWWRRQCRYVQAERDCGRDLVRMDAAFRRRSSAKRTARQKSCL